MPLSRGMVKVEVRGENNEDLTVESVFNSLGDWTMEYLPYVLDFSNWITGRVNNEYDRELVDKVQQWWNTVWNKNYMFYGEDVEVIYHGSDTETFETGTGTQTGVQTNQESYREFRMKTTISPRDYDVIDPIGGNAWSKSSVLQRSGEDLGIFGFVFPFLQISDFFMNLIYNTTGGGNTRNPEARNVIENYLRKRQNFFIEIFNNNGTNIAPQPNPSPAVGNLRISSSLFKPADVKLTECTCQTPIGQQESIFTFHFVEVKQLEDINNQFANTTALGEPGTAPY